MRYFMTTLHFTLLQRLGNLRNWIILLLLPMLTLSASFMLPEWRAESAVCVGVVLPESGGEEMWKQLQSHNNDVISFILTDENTLERNIAAGRWDCGIILAEDFDQKLAELDTDRIFTLQIGPGSTIYPMVKETISACVAQLIAPNIAIDYLLNSDMVNEDFTLSLEEPNRVLVSMSSLDSQPIQIPELATRGTKNFLQWLICVSILVRILFGAADLAKWLHTPGMNRMAPLRAPLCSIAARGTADSILLFFSASAAMHLLGEGFWSCLAVLAYVIFWLMVSLLLAQFPNMTTILHVFAPFAVVISLLLSSVIMDISLIYPQLSSISPWLPVSRFLRICDGSFKDLIILLAGGIPFLGFAWGISLTRRKT